MSRALITDLYELTMAYAYFREGKNEPATFDLFVRPPVAHRRFLLVAGVDAALDYLENLYFAAEDLQYLEDLGIFDAEFLDYLTKFRFTGEVLGFPEGAIAFPGEPLLRVTAPRIEAQIVETYLLNAVNHQTLIASKAARILLAAGADAMLVDFSPRRDPGEEASLKVARAAYLAGFNATSNLEASRIYGIPPSGTMAHSYVMSHDDELEAFRSFARHYYRPLLLIDTYDTLNGAENALTVARELAQEGREVLGVRLDSGNLVELSRQVRAKFDRAGFPNIKIFISGDLDEYRILDFQNQGGSAWGYGIGTRLGISEDSPALAGVYKLVHDTRGPQIKKSPGKVTLPGRKQVWREAGYHDTLGLEGESLPGTPVLQALMREGKRLAPPQDLHKLREQVRHTLLGLPTELALIQSEPNPTYPVQLSAALAEVLTSLSGQ